jgi:hypothetical protein
MWLGREPTEVQLRLSRLSSHQEEAVEQLGRDLLLCGQRGEEHLPTFKEGGG